ncbi:hypothetical protein LCGC14_2914800, partial [marine sediment metagenome]
TEATGGQATEPTDAAAEPTEAPPEPAGPATSFEDGTFIIGEDIVAGTYVTSGSSFCYWERLSGFSGDLDDIIANGATEIRQIVAIDPSDSGFTSNDCGMWTQDLSPITSDPAAPFGDGMYQVGVDVAAGTWRSDGATDLCYWARLSSFSSELDNILANDIGGGQHIVTIAPGDVGFEASDCGTWTKIE